MVRDGSSSTEPISFEDATPTSDLDPYSTTQEGPGGDKDVQYHIDASSLPKPVPVIGRLLGYDEYLFKKVLQSKLNSGINVLKRAPTQDEAAAYAYWTAKQISIFSYGAPLGIIGGLYRAYSTSATFRFPFWQPNMEKLNAQSFPPRFPILKGNRALMAWHSCRIAMYGSIGNWIGQILFGSYSVTVAAVGELSDPRLKVLTTAIRDQTRKKAGGLQNPIPQGTQQGTAQPSSQPQDDASPTGGFHSDESAGLGSTMGGAMVNDNLRREEGRRKQWPQPKVQPQVEHGDTPERSYTEFDDALPTAGRESQAEPPQGSAWDRLRSGATQPSDRKTSSWEKRQQSPDNRQHGGQSTWSKYQNNTQQESMDGSADTFSFSKSDEQRNLAKAQAQREFDAQVDRERRGGEFTTASERRP